MEYIQLFVDQEIGYLSIDRPDKHNAFNAELIGEIKIALQQLNDNDDVRVIIIRSTGKNFCAGADLNWMRAMADFSHEENQKDAQLLADLFYQIYSCPKPTIALTNGWVLGGGIGIVCCCDFAIGATNSTYCFSEVKLGLVPATISPFVIRKIGLDAANRYFITADKFDAETALDLNLICEVVTLGEMEDRGVALAKQIMHNGPHAIQASKALMRDLIPLRTETIEQTSALIAKLRVSPEAQEGLSAFLDKRQPNWIKK
ncbi:MAG: enoyl-CoA hydratase/isomerase family protein [Coxiellaceae bacterium]|nr:enoyl-CoA hydratase/isomerase family protein [Coxiellaceae bacterium]